jgi:hypothetical protein
MTLRDVKFQAQLMTEPFTVRCIKAAFGGGAMIGVGAGPLNDGKRARTSADLSIDLTNPNPPTEVLHVLQGNGWCRMPTQGKHGQRWCFISGAYTAC